MTMPASIPCVPHIHVTMDEQTQYDAFASRLLHKAVADYSEYKCLVDTQTWALVRKKHQMSVYRSLLGTDDPRVTLMVGTGLIPGSLEDVMDGIYCDTTDTLRAVKTFTTKKFVDGAVLSVSEKRIPEAPFRFAGIKWSVAKAAWGVVKHRDILTYERMGTTMDAHGNELAFHVLQSIERPEWIVDAVKGVKRAQTATCYLYRRCNSRVQCFVWAELYDLGSAATRRVAEYVVAGVLLNVVRSVECAKAKRYSRLMTQAKTKAWTSINSCSVCLKSPSIFERLVECAGCLQNACKSCSQLHSVFEVDMRTGVPVQERFCKLCVSRVLAPVASAGGTQKRHQQSQVNTINVASAFAENLKTGNSSKPRKSQQPENVGEQRDKSTDRAELKFMDLADLQCYVTSSSDDDSDCESMSSSLNSSISFPGEPPVADSRFNAVTLAR